MVKIKTIRDFLGEHPFFAGMQPRYLDLIAGCGELAHFEAGSFLMKEDDPAAHFFLILKGKASIEVHAPATGPLTIGREDAGGIVGFSWLFPPYRVAFDVHALTDIETVLLHGECLRGKAEQDHELGYELMTRFSRLLLERLQTTRRRLLDVYGETDAAAKTG